MLSTIDSDISSEDEEEILLNTHLKCDSFITSDSDIIIENITDNHHQYGELNLNESNGYHEPERSQCFERAIFEDVVSTDYSGGNSSGFGSDSEAELSLDTNYTKNGFSFLKSDNKSISESELCESEPLLNSRVNWINGQLTSSRIASSVQESHLGGYTEQSSDSFGSSYAGTSLTANWNSDPIFGGNCIRTCNEVWP